MPSDVVTAALIEASAKVAEGIIATCSGIDEATKQAPNAVRIGFDLVMDEARKHKLI